MKRWWWLVVLMGCAHAPEESRKAEAATPAAPRLQEWVDGSAPPDGDGTKERPFKVLAPRSGYTTHVATGLYEVSGALSDDVELVGTGKAVVVYGDGLTVTSGTFRRLAIQGGEVGLTVKGPVALEQVAFSGQRKVAVQVDAAGRLTVNGADFDGTVPETSGVVSWGRVTLAGVTFRGALRRGLKVEAGEATVTDSKSEGAATVVHVSGGRATVRRVRAVAGRGPAFYAMGARLELRDIEVVGHELAVQGGLKAVIGVEGLKSDHGVVGVIAAVGADLTLKRITAVSPGSHGAVEALEGITRVEDLTVTDATDYVVMQRHGRLEAKRVRIKGVRGTGGTGGDGVMVRDAIAVLSDIEVIDAGGTGVVATAVATVDIDGLRCEGCAYGALLVERRSTVKARRVVSEGAREAAVSVPDDGVLELDGLEVKGSGLGVWSECTAGSRVVLKGKLPARELLSGRCLEFPPASAPR